MDTQWHIIYKKLQEKLSPKTCEVWIAPLGVRIEETNLHLSAPNSFIANWIRSHFAANIEEAMQDTGLMHLNVHVQNPTPETSVLAQDAQPLSQQNGQPVYQQSGQPVYQGTQPLNQQNGQPVYQGTQPLNQQSGQSVNQQSARQPHAKYKDHAYPILGSPTHIPLPLTQTSFGHLYTAWRHDFDSFVVGKSNDLAHAAARTMTQSMRAVDTLFLSSSPGLGKTHLTQAVGKALCDTCNRVQPRTAYLTAENFATSYVQAMQNRNIEQFKSRFRDVDILLLEDIQFLQNKPKMQEELLGVIKSLQENASRVVFTSAFAPKELKDIDEQLVSRFASGFLANIEKPDKVMRIRILIEKARKHDTALPLDVATALAERLRGDVRQLESAVHTLILRARLVDCPITVDLANQVLAQYCATSCTFDLDNIIRQVSEGFNLTLTQLSSRSRKQENVTARNTIFYLARQHTDLSLEELGERFNRRHSTVIKGIDTIERALRRQSSLGRQVEHFIARMQTKS